MNRNSNIGESGMDSIRLNGMKIEDLPMGQNNEAREGLAQFIKTDKETKANNIRGKYPKQSAEYLEAAIRECEHNIEKIKEFKKDLHAKMRQYQQLVNDCLMRDREMQKYNKENPDDAAKMKELRLKYPPYDIDALNNQIAQFQDGIVRSDEVIEQDFNSISEAKQVLVLVKQRDKELLNIK